MGWIEDIKHERDSGFNRPLDQLQHEQYNTVHYPGTRQLCYVCDQPTGRCEDDSILDDNGNPICEECRGPYSDSI